MNLKLSITSLIFFFVLSCGGKEPIPNQGEHPNPGGGNSNIQVDADALYNGIKLPGQWPMRRNYATYIRSGINPSDVWTRPNKVVAKQGRQLFVDDFLIKSTTLQRVYHYPQVSEQPVLVPDQTWEITANGKSKFAAPFSDGVWFDEITKKFKMWYLAGGDATCYAESSDGIVWTKPSLDIEKGTNIIRKGYVRDSSSVWIDKGGEGDRYRMFEVSGGAGKWVYHYLTSTDGIHWRDQQTNSQRVADRSTVFYSPFRKVWIWSMRHNVRVRNTDPYTIRARDYMENVDPKEGNKAAVAHLDNFWFGPWPNEEKWSSNTDNDGAPGIYNQDAMPYESIMLGFFSVWQGPENNVCNETGIIKRNQIMLGYSRDGGYSYYRDMKPFISLSTNPNSYRSGNLQSSIGSPIIVGDKLYFYFSGRKMDNGVEITSTGMATLRRDGFASLRGSGTLTTVPIIAEGNTLWVNARIGGSLKIEVLDEEGTTMPQFTTFIKSVDSCTIKVVEGLAELLKTKVITLRFIADDCDIYSFWIGDSVGHSQGYTAGGGPGLNSIGIDK